MALRVLGVIPARGGSKGIPRKNLAPLLGRPLIAYTIAAALASPSLGRVIVSTEDEEIAAVARSLGADVPYLRSAELARDETPTIHVLQELVARLQEQGEHYDAVFTLQPTAPLRIAEDIEGVIATMVETGADSVISFTSAGSFHPAKLKFIDGEKRVSDPPFGEEFLGWRRQELPPLYRRDGAAYLTRRDVLMEQNSLTGDDCRAWITPRERACDIDEPIDLFLAEQLLRRAGWEEA